ncbi:glycosyl transferase group 1 [Thiohalocapsa halophila]|uniref:Glycosyl transferase group 1 n=1 Tax=Thiohalocapsa halophila TaxID=69359 RepID=A0ABS1CLD8_9GAMM|nr:glycosyltransferase [Thiohalocapsa halophila]MBK1632663.1 glycosyl transferase group 1 [Thiohalocapsa halophila]
MRFCDLTLAYTETSGGIRTYIDHKRRYIAEATDHEHVLIVPGERDRVSRDGPLTKIELQSPVIPGCRPYRFFWQPAKIRHALERSAPDIVELGSFFVSPWAAFRYREECHEVARPCLVSAYFHTDVAEAYVGAPLRHFLGEGVEEISDTLSGWGHRLSDAIESGAEATFGQIFRRCDLTFAATEAQAARIREYGVEGTRIVPLGVDLDMFSPARRSLEWRRGHGITDHDLLLMYCGRLDNEKDVMLLADAFTRLVLADDCASPKRPPGSPPSRCHLMMLGDGPLHDQLARRAEQIPRLHLPGYEADRARHATALASADIYVTAGPHETFGLAVVEAQAAGLPVVGVDAGALRERVVSGTGRLGPVGDAEAFAANIRAVAAERKAMGAAAREHVVSAGYGWERTFELLLDIYAGTFAGRSAATTH